MANGYQLGICCHSTEHLNWVLKCTRSTPLTLSIDWPIDLDQLTLVSSRNCPIHPLLLDVGWAKQPKAIYDGIKAFNLSSLHKLDLYAKHSDFEDVAMILDLALQSTREKLQLELDIRQSIPKVFNHRLIRRLGSLKIMAGQ
jgi:hypothetical protein